MHLKLVFAGFRQTLHYAIAVSTQNEPGLIDCIFRVPALSHEIRDDPLHQDVTGAFGSTEALTALPCPY